MLSLIKEPQSAGVTLRACAKLRQRTGYAGYGSGVVTMLAETVMLGFLVAKVGPRGPGGSAQVVSTWRKSVSIRKTPKHILEVVRVMDPD